MKKHAKGFSDYVREQGVVGLAVGLAIGTAAGEAVKSLVENLINPIVGFILGGTDLSKYSWNVITIGDDRSLTIGWGAILGAVITLLATAFVIYQVVHLAKLDRMDKKKD